MTLNRFALALVAGSVCSTAMAQNFDSPKLPKLPPTSGQPTLQVVTSNLVGGSDDPSTAIATNSISGAGAFAVDSTLATTGTPVATCGAMGTDVWFYWTAAASGLTTINLCGSTTADTALAAWSASAGAPLAQIVCNDDSCGLQSQITLNAVAGTSYFIEVGSYASGAGYTGTLTVTAPTPPIANDECTGAIALTGAGPWPFNNTSATTGTVGQTEAVCLFFGLTAIANDEWFTWSASQSGTATLSVCAGIVSGGNDTKVAIYDGAGCPVTAAIACNDDATCAGSGLRSTVTWAANCGQSYTIQLGRYNGATASQGTFSIVEGGVPCVSGTAYCFGDGTGAVACPCGNNSAVGAGEGCLSSLGVGAKLGGSGNPSIAGDSLVLAGTGMPNSNALYFQGTTQIAAAFGDGLRCAGGSIIRLGTKTNAAGASAYPAAGDLSVSARGLVTAPGVRNYQVWYRNAAAFCTASTFNLTNGYEITWAP